jgi:branched-chain amino acid transport system substrate-binding protein
LDEPGPLDVAPRCTANSLKRSEHKVSTTSNKRLNPPWSLRKGATLFGTCALGIAVAIVPVAPSMAQAAAGGSTTMATNVVCTAAVGPKCVTVGNVSTVGGIVPGLFEGAQIGTDAYLSLVNAAGGVNGRMIRLDDQDDAFNGTNNRAETESLVSKVDAFVGSFSLADASGGAVLQQHPGVANVSASLSSLTSKLPNTYSVAVAIGGWQLGPLLWFKKHYPTAIKHVGILAVDESAATYQLGGMEAAMKHEGFDIVYSGEFSPFQSDFSQQILRMRSAGVQYVDLTAMNAPFAEKVVQQMHQQRFTPSVIESAGFFYSNGFAKAAGGNAVADGIYNYQTVPLYLGGDKSTVPAVGQFLKWVNTVHPGWSPDAFTLTGWESAELYVQALKAAGANPTPAAVETQLKKIKNFTAGGLTAPVSPAAHVPAKCWIMTKLENGRFTRIPPSPKNGGFVCSGGYYKR